MLRCRQRPQGGVGAGKIAGNKAGNVVVHLEPLDASVCFLKEGANIPRQGGGVQGQTQRHEWNSGHLSSTSQFGSALQDRGHACYRLDLLRNSMGSTRKVAGKSASPLAPSPCRG